MAGQEHRHHRVDDGACPEHSGICAVTKRNSDDIQLLWVAINTMKTWVILGMGALVLQFGLFVLKTFVHFG
jgi:hypothetical protein